MSLLTELDAFHTEHRWCDEVEAGVYAPVVWLACGCGATMARRDPAYLVARRDSE